MNFFAAFQSEIFRPLVTLLIPGALAISSWFVALCLQFPKFKQIIAQHSTESYLVLFLLVTAMGIVIEDIGARIELSFDQELNKRTGGKFEEEWSSYLKTAFVADPIGRGYARTLLLRLKFQLGILLASIIAGLGVVWLFCLGLPCSGAFIFWAAAAIAATWHYKAAKDVHGALSRVRHELAQEIRIVAIEKSH